MNKPTNAQVKEFWEGCGWADNPKIIPSYWTHPDEEIGRWNLPSVNLNNLFKYAVPKIRYVDLTKPDGKTTYSASARNGEGIVGETGYCFDNEDPALSLFWAIYPVITSKEN